MNAIEKFTLGESAEITRIKSGAVIMLDNIFFYSIRKVMRGLEEHLAKGEENHDFINGTYVYQINNSDRDSIFVRFERGSCIIGSKILYSC